MITRNDVVLVALILANVSLLIAALVLHARAQVAPVVHRSTPGVPR